MTEDQKVAISVASSLLREHFEFVQVVYRGGEVSEIVLVEPEYEEEEAVRWKMN
jgi:hypothetical protein